MSETYEGYLLIADITGYTRYLSESELEHAQETLTALLELLVENTRPPLIISRLAGDAVISYGLRESFFQGQTIIEKIEDTYVAFRKRIDRLVLNNVCRCNACANISYLDLKFFIHYGTFGIQRISDHDELIGSDINLIHRLLKNSVTEKTGIRAYALFTTAAIQQMGSEDLIEGMTHHSEAYDYFGEVEVWVQDMQPVWGKKRGDASITFPTDQLWMRHEIDISIPREQVWDYLIQPEFRHTLMGVDRMEIANLKNGRIAPNSVFQCYHGDKMVPQTILEWQPFESMIVKELFPMNHAVSWLAEYHLDSTTGGTRLSGSYSKAEGPFAGKMLHRLLSPLFKRIVKQFFERFAQRIESDYQARSETLKSEFEVTGQQIRDAAAASLQTSSSGNKEENSKPNLQKEKPMSVKVQVSQVINRPVTEVFNFYAHEHVRNHPRWDPDMNLEQVTEGPIGVGTIIKRRNTRSGTPVEGTMEIVEFEPNRAFGMVIHDGTDEIQGRATFKAESQEQTILTINAEFIGMDESLEGWITGLIERTGRNIKQLIEVGQLK